MNDLLTPEQLAEIRARDAARTPGEWRWFGNAKIKTIYLATVKSGRITVMDFVRWGMGNAAPRFAVDGFMRRADEVLDTVPHSGTIVEVMHPNAQFIEQCSLDVPRLLAHIDALGAQRVRPEEVVA